LVLIGDEGSFGFELDGEGPLLCSTLRRSLRGACMLLIVTFEG
jgi:hypothetical protein